MSTFEFVQEENVVEIRYEGLNATQLAALTTRVDELEDLVEAGGGESGAAIAALQNDVDALEAAMAVVQDGLADEIDRATAAEAQLGDDITAVAGGIAGDIATAVSAEAALRVAGDNDEAAARDVAIAAAVDPVIADVSSLSSAVGSLSSDVVAAQAAVAVVAADLATETAARIAGDTTNSDDIDDLVTALFDETAAREAFQATLGNATYLTENDETADFPNSRMLLEGTGVTFDDSVPGERTINVSGSGGNLDDLGDVDTTGVADGDVLTYDSGTSTWVAAAPIGGGGGGSTLINPDTPPSSPADADDEFEYGTSVDTTGARRTGATAWAWFNQNSSTDAVNASQGNLRMVSGTGTDVMQMIGQAIAAGSTWKYRSKFTVAATSNYGHGGLAIYNSGNGRSIEFGVQINGTMYISCFRYTSWVYTSTLTASTSVGAAFFNLLPFWYWELESDGTTLYFRVSHTGYEGSFIQIATETIASFMGTITHIGLSFNAGGGSPTPVFYCDWFRQVA